jgi:hypothetical protein
MVDAVSPLLPLLQHQCKGAVNQGDERRQWLWVDVVVAMDRMIENKQPERKQK